MRDEIVRLLAEREMTVTELSKVLGVSKATVSYHIEELKRIGLVKVAREEIIRNFVRRYYTLSIPNANVGERIINSIKRSVNKKDRAEVFRNTVRLLGFVLLRTSPSLFKRVGFEVGKSLSQSNAKIEELADLWEKLGFGKTSCTSKSLTVEECYFCSGLPKVGYTYCKFDEGFIAGFLSPKGMCRVEEVRCWGLGDEFCEFRIEKLD
ncbi:V4R domain-containing protein [Archaeoglobus sp.]